MPTIHRSSRRQIACFSAGLLCGACLSGLFNFGVELSKDPPGPRWYSAVALCFFSMPVLGWFSVWPRFAALGTIIGGLAAGILSLHSQFHHPLFEAALLDDLVWAMLSAAMVILGAAFGRARRIHLEARSEPHAGAPRCNDDDGAATGPRRD